MDPNKIENGPAVDATRALQKTMANMASVATSLDFAVNGKGDYSDRLDINQTVKMADIPRGGDLSAEENKTVQNVWNIDDIY